MENEEARDERKKRFIAAIKDKKCRALIEPLSQKIKSYMKSEIPPEDVFKSARYVSRQGEDLQADFKKKPDVILAGIAMDENKYITEIGGIGVKVRQGDIMEIFTDAIVNPASPDGKMSAGIAGAIKNAGGEEIENEAISRAPIQPGDAIATGAGTLPMLHIIHTPTGDVPSGESSPGKIKLAVSAALKLAEELEIETLTVPGMGTGAGRVPPEESANAVIEAIESHGAGTVSSIILADRGEEMVSAFVSALEKYDEENE